MEAVKLGLEPFQSVQGYFIADHRTLHYIKLNRDLWDKASVISKFGALGLNGHIPDMKLNEVQDRFHLDDVKQGIQQRDMNLFEILCSDLDFLKEARYVVSYLLCAHDPIFFPIWDTRRKRICEWEARGELATYTDLKTRLDRCKSENECQCVDYFMFNKLLWLCE
ncbi:MAG: hypothetical protein RLO17_24615 [Cyclobacteriaceae bacterium]|jgi:hypothetical protein|tara:strand:- start:745 stop:1242 length:498 start_codon:yes stop_codon:yes gene_type:complete